MEGRRKTGFFGLRARIALLAVLVSVPAFAAILGDPSGHRGTLALAGLILLTALLAGNIIVVLPVRRLAKAVRRLSQGDRTARAALRGAGELGELAHAVEDFVASIEARDREMRRAQAKLRESTEALQRTGEHRRFLLAHLSRAQEEERSRIAAEIHDDSIQVMTAVGLRLATLRLGIKDPGHLRLLDEVEQSVGDAVARLRSLLFELRPPALDRDGLAPALRLYLQQSSREGGFRYGVDNRLRREPSPGTRAILYRISQEALANVRKHAEASHVEVMLAEMDGGYLVRVSDNGKGLDDAGGAGALGMTEMRERAELAGGWWRANGRPGVGTVVEFWVPEVVEEASVAR